MGWATLILMFSLGECGSDYRSKDVSTKRMPVFAALLQPRGEKGGEKGCPDNKKTHKKGQKNNAIICVANPIANKSSTSLLRPVTPHTPKKSLPPELNDLVHFVYVEAARGQHDLGGLVVRDPLLGLQEVGLANPIEQWA